MKKEDLKGLIVSDSIEASIHVIRGGKVILDQDLAQLYGVTTKVFNQAVQRNIDRFPEDFSFKLSQKEWEILRSQFVTSRLDWGGRRYKPMVFTEHGVVMAANVLKSKRAKS